MARSIHVVETQDKVELTDSVRYREGLGEREVVPRVPGLGDEERFCYPPYTRVAAHFAG